jgi:hypothetical protein
MNAVWIPRESNDKADSLSRKLDCNDWEIEYFIFKYLDNLWGPHFSDRFGHACCTGKPELGKKIACI